MLNLLPKKILNYNILLKSSIASFISFFLNKSIFIIIALLLFVINDFMYHDTFMFSHRLINSIFPSSIQVILSYLLTKEKKYYILLSVAIFNIFNIIRALSLLIFLFKNIRFFYS